ncbi:MAG: site-specific integrase [Gallionella sp.]|nr:site-specific integrase [Gallionella sp.]
MATIVKTPSGTYKALIRRQGWPTTSKTFRTKRDAEDWSRRTEDEMVRGVYIQRSSSERLTLENALERYLREISPSKSKGSHESDITRSKPLISALGDYSLAAISPDLAAKYRDDRLATVSKRTKRPISSSSVRLELALLSHLYTVAIQEWGVGLIYNPVMNIRKPSPAPARNRRLLPDEEGRLIKAIEGHSNPMFAWIVKLALYTGMRAGEIASLRRGQVNLTRRVIHLPKTKNGEARNVPLTKAAAETAGQAMENPIRPLDSDLVFFGEPGRDGKRRPYVCKKIWNEMVKREGFVGLHFHDLRHELISRLVEAGLSDQKVAAISGHKTMQMLKRYTHLRAEDLVAELDAVGCK